MHLLMDVFDIYNPFCNFVLLLHPHKTPEQDWQYIPMKKQTFWKSKGARGDIRFRSLNETIRSDCVVHDDGYGEDDDEKKGDWNYYNSDGDYNGAHNNGK
jgi:hypothetical protein